jgi:hypothetical protein
MKTNNKTLSVVSGLIYLFGLTASMVNAQAANFTNPGNHGNNGRISSIINSARPNSHLNINLVNTNQNSAELGNGLLNGNLVTSNIANLNQQQINLAGINSYQSLSNISKNPIKTNSQSTANAFNSNAMQNSNNIARSNNTNSTPTTNLTDIISNLPNSDWAESSKNEPNGGLSENVSEGSINPVNLSDVIVTSLTDNDQSTQRCDHADFSIVKSRSTQRCDHSDFTIIKTQSTQRCDHSDFSIIKSQPNARCDHADFSVVANH